MIIWKNLALVGSFLLLTPVALATSLFSLFTISQTQTIAPPSQKATVYASLPSSFPSESGSIGSLDARIEIVRQYLKSYNSPLTKYAEKIVDAADKYGLDFRLIPAIAQQESNLCKIIPPGSHNCWGWGINSESNLGFASYDDAIETVSAGIRSDYMDKGYTTPEQIMTKYTPLSKGSWAKGVSQFMSEME